VAYAAYYNLAVALAAADEMFAAENAYQAAIELKPDFLEARLNLGTLLEKKGEAEQALAAWQAAADLADLGVEADRKLHIQALNNIGRLLEIRHCLPEAEEVLSRSLLQDPQQPDVMSHLVHLRQKLCHWPVFAPLGEASSQALRDATSALALLSAATDPAEQLATARRYIAEKVRTDVPPLSDGSTYGHSRLRIGYLSGDLCSHAVSILTAELYELHDRSRFEIYAFSWSREDGTPLRHRVVAAMDHYIPIGAMSDEEAARCIRARTSPIWRSCPTEGLGSSETLVPSMKEKRLVQRPMKRRKSSPSLVGSTSAQGTPWLPKWRMRASSRRPSSSYRSPSRSRRMSRRSVVVS